MKQNLFDLLTNEECAITPIDDVIRLLLHAHESFHLGEEQLTEAQRYDLIAQHEDLGSILMIVVNVLSATVNNFNDAHSKIIQLDDPEKE